MKSQKKIILDANILIRGVLGSRVCDILERYKDDVLFYTAGECFDDAREYLPKILEKRGYEAPEKYTLQSLDQLQRIVQPFYKQFYGRYENEAKQRIKLQDIEDWPLVALSLTMDCPLWTEDKDFFGTGISTWRTCTVEIYLGEEVVELYNSG